MLSRLGGVTFVSFPLFFSAIFFEPRIAFPPVQILASKKMNANIKRLNRSSW